MAKPISIGNIGLINNSSSTKNNLPMVSNVVNNINNAVSSYNQSKSKNNSSSGSNNGSSEYAFEPSSIDGGSDKEKDKAQKKPQSEMSISNNATESSDLVKQMLNPDTIKSNESDLKKLRRTLSIYDSPNKSAAWLWEKSTEYYNRFKVATLDDAFTRGFGHVFFVKPMCNISESNDGGSPLTVTNPMFQYANTSSPATIKELTYSGNGTGTDGNDSPSFMLSLSNKVTNFSLNDEFINEGVTGKTYTGTQIAYGKDISESRSVNNLSITFKDDKYLHVYQLHRLWLEYISGVYRGTMTPTKNTITEKILDYAGAVYYIITGNDGETILYWEKYYGIFPTNISTDSLNWDIEKLISNPTFTVTYRYSIRNSYDPAILSEFNMNGGSNKSSSAEPIFDKELGHVGPSWVGMPYIEEHVAQTSTSNETTKSYKLKFAKKSLEVY